MLKTLLILLISIALYADILTPLPQHPDYDKKKAALGKELFFDPILSRDGSIACVNCHTLPGSGADSNPVSIGVEGRHGNIQSPTVLNARYNFKQFWDGRAEDLYEQAKGPIENPVEMGNTLEHMLSTLQKSHYKEDFQKVYKDGLSIHNVLDSIAEFEKALVTPNSKFDKYLRAETGLSTQEVKGYELFKTKGCISCHSGINIGGAMFQKFGIIFDLYEVDPDRMQRTVDLGRYNVTHNPEDRYYFKVPTLRNIALTAPYFHDAKAKTLKDAIKTMYFYQLGFQIKEQDLDAIEAFLKTLTGQTPEILQEH